MASGTIKQESWIEVSPVAAITGDTQSGAGLTFYKKGNILRAIGFVAPTDTSTVVTVTLKSEYRLYKEAFLYTRYSGWTSAVQEQSQCFVSDDGASFSFGAGNFAYCSINHDFMLK